MHVEEIASVMKALTPKKKKNRQQIFMLYVLEPVIRAHNDYDYTYRRTFLTHMQLIG